MCVQFSSQAHRSVSIACVHAFRESLCFCGMAEELMSIVLCQWERKAYLTLSVWI